MNEIIIYEFLEVESTTIYISLHKYKAKLYPERKIYKHFAKRGNEHFKIKLIKNYPCADRTALDIEEEMIKI
jgi:hypothetical protein